MTEYKCPDCGGDTHVFVDKDKRSLFCTPGCGWTLDGAEFCADCGQPWLEHDPLVVAGRGLGVCPPPRTSQEDDRG
jgi:hypothetical protein